jgi:hypothetical protein
MAEAAELCKDGDIHKEGVRPSPQIRTLSEIRLSRTLLTDSIPLLESLSSRTGT